MSSPDLSSISDHFYLMITPNPEGGNSIQVKDEILTKDGKVKRKGVLHYVKLGDEKGYEDRVHGYGTENPDFWVREIAILNPKLMEKPQIAKRFEDLLKPYAQSSQGPEWHLIWDRLDGLKQLCKILDHVGKAGGVWDKPLVDNYFPEEDDFRKIFEACLDG